MVAREAVIQGAIAYMRGTGQSGDIRVHVLDDQSQEAVDGMVAYYKQMYEQAEANCKVAQANYEANLAETNRQLQRVEDLKVEYEKRIERLDSSECFYTRQDRDKYQMALFAVLRHLVNVLQVKLGRDKYKPYESIVVLKARLIEIMKTEVDLLDDMTKARPGFADFVVMEKLQPFLDAVIDEPSMLAPEPHCSARMLSRDLVHYIHAKPDKARFRFCEPLMARYAFALLLITVGYDEATNVLRWLIKDGLSKDYVTSTMLAGLEKLHEFDPDAGIKDKSKRHLCLDDRLDDNGVFVAWDSDDDEGSEVEDEEEDSESETEGEEDEAGSEGQPGNEEADGEEGEDLVKGQGGNEDTA